jgi:plasmid stability protein
MARTTLDVDDDLLATLKVRAAREGRSMQSLANDILRHALQSRRSRPFRLHLEGWKADLQPGIDLFDRDSLIDRLEGR